MDIHQRKLKKNGEIAEGICFFVSKYASMGFHISVKGKRRPLRPKSATTSEINENLHIVCGDKSLTKCETADIIGILDI